MNDEPGIVSQALALLVRALKEERPAVLFLGQDFAVLGGNDPILHSLMDRLGRGGDAAKSWRSLLDKPISSDDLQWLTERFERNIQSEMVQSTLDVSWRRTRENLSVERASIYG